MDVGELLDRLPVDRLLKLSSDIQFLAEAIAPSPERAEAAISPEDIRAVIRARRRRDQFFGSDLFADPAWDMMLDLFAARLERRKVAVSSLCIAAAVPPTTALRWIGSLCSRGILVRVADPDDGRRVFIDLAEETADQINAYFTHAVQFGVSLQNTVV